MDTTKKPPLGKGLRFQALKEKLSHKKGVTNAAALSAWIGRKKFGAKKFTKLSVAGRK